jgi:EmrB/QacA subfamily drug resistance transporter
VLVFAGLLLTAGSLGDRFGRQKALIAGLVVFGGGSLLTLFVDSANGLIGVRAVMGIGGALIMPATLSILTNVFEADERPKAIAAWASVAGLGIVVGPTVGGWLLEHYSWHSLFLVNVPVVAIALVLARTIVPNSQDEAPEPIDIPGSVLSVAALATLLYGIIEAPAHGWLSAESLAMFAAGGALLAALTIVEWRSSHPMLNVRFFQNARFSAASLSITLVYFALMGTMFFLTQHLQLVQGFSTFKAGLGLAPVAIAFALAAPVSTYMTKRFGAKITVFTGLLTVAVGLGIFANVTVDSSYLFVASSLLISGLGVGIAMTPATDSIMGSLPLDKAGVGSAVNDTTREVGGALGVAILGSVLSSAYASEMASKVGSLSAGDGAIAKDSLGGAFSVAGSLSPEAAAALLDASKHAFVHAEVTGLLVGTAISVVGALIALVFLPSRAVEPVAEVSEGDEAWQYEVMGEVAS